MIKLKHILTELLLQEALPHSVAKEYTSIKRNKSIIKRLDSIFNKLKELPNATTSKREDRVYLPFTKSTTSTKSPIEKEVTNSLPSEYKMKDYKKGIVIDKFGREVKLNKVLTKIGKSDLVNKVNTDKTRESSKVSEYVVVFSRHPYDIAGMSTDRGWTSCMNLYDGENVKYVSKDIKEGSFICYITKKEDLNLKNPIARVLIKPYVNVQNKNDVIYSPEKQYYGTPPTGVIKFVTATVGKIQDKKIGIFNLVSSLYCDSGETTIMKLPPELQKVLDGEIKPTTKEQVEFILMAFGVKNYTINSDLTVDVKGDVDISSKKLKVIPVNFRDVGGSFYCVNNNLTTLEGAPQKVGGGLRCHKNNLVTLKGAPKEVRGDFYCDQNKLTSLEGAPQKVGGDFYCDENKLTSLEGAPQKVGGDFYCDQNNLTSLEGAPQKVGGDFECHGNNLTSLKGAPQKVGGDFICHNNKKQFATSDVKAVSDVRHEIYVE